MKVTPRIGKVVAILSVKEDTDLMIITKDGKIIRLESGEIRQAGRSTQGRGWCAWMKATWRQLRR
jgi:DNA gyrase subunit A